MKKILILLLSLALALTAGTTAFAAAEVDGPEVAEGWIIPEGYEGRVSVKKTDEGIVIDQLVQGTPRSHAVAIAAPVDGTNGFEVTFRIESEEYVASGRLANDVWTGIGFMGKPEFIHWSNNETYGYAKDSPGLFTRFLNYAGDYHIITDVYCGDYVKDLDNPSDLVDTWTLLDANAGASADRDVTMKLSWDEKDGKSFYNIYINGQLISGGGELASVEPDKVFPDGKIYLEIAMNTQKKESNSNSRVTIRSINGVSYVKQQGGAANDSSSGESVAAKSGGCGSSFGGLSALSAVLLGALVALKRKKDV